MRDGTSFASMTRELYMLDLSDLVAQPHRKA